MDHEPIWNAYAAGASKPELRVVGGAEAKERPPLVLHPARLPDPCKINPRRWLYGTQLVRGFVTVLVAPGGTGKSSYAMGVGVACASGQDILGEKIFERVNAAIINLEDPMDELERRLAALMIQHHIARPDLDGHLFLDDSEGRGLTMAAVGDDGYTIIHPDEAAMIEQVKANNIGLIICDPFAESHSLEENNNPQMVKAAAAWRRVARATDAAILLVHHVRKGEASGIDAARGAKALTDSSRVGLLLSPMTKEDGD
ncbi:MAG TPA: AAA family ATPase, partial [Polyangia bacterium]|nr:AAA family ATPase [Polyangia bacterium]